MRASTSRATPDKQIQENQSRRERGRFQSIFRLDKNRPSVKPTEPQAKGTGLHLEYALTGLNATMFEDAILESIQMKNDGRSWSSKNKDLATSLAKLEMLNHEHIHNPEIPPEGRENLWKVFLNIANEVLTQQTEIDNEISSRRQNVESETGQTPNGKNKASSSRSAKKAIDAHNKGLKELELAKKTLDEIGVQAGRLLDIAEPVREKLRTLASRMRELECEAEDAAASLEAERLATTMGREKSKAKSKSEILNNPELTPLERQASLHSTDQKNQSLIHMQGNMWTNRLDEYSGEQSEVADQIVKLFDRAASEGTDLAKELNNDEIVYLTRAMGLAEGKREERGLSIGELKTAELINESAGGTKSVTVTEVIKQDSDRLAMQNARLLHGPQLQNLLTRLDDQGTRLENASNALASRHPDAAVEVLQNTEEVLGALRRIDRAEVSRLRNESGANREMTTSLLAGELDRIQDQAENLRGLILTTLASPDGSRLAAEDKRKLEQSVKLLEHVKSGVVAL